MRIIKKRLFALFLAAAMLAASVDMSALAAENGMSANSSEITDPHVGGGSN